MTRFMTIAEFKTRYRISHTSFYREVSEGRIPLRKFGRASRVAEDDAEAWAASLPVRNGRNG